MDTRSAPVPPPFPLSEEGRIRSIAVVGDSPGEPGSAMPFAARLAGRLGGRLVVEERPDLLVLGTRAAAGSATHPLGAEARRALAEAEAPCLVARGSLSLPLRRVLLPIDFSDLACGTIPLAAAWMAAYLRTEAEAGNPGRTLELHVLHVARDADEERLMDIELAGEIRRVLEETGPKPPVSIRKLVHPGRDAVAEILRVAERHTIDAILMRAFEARSWIRRPAGSVPADVLRRARCPVVLLPPRLWMSAAAAAPATHPFPAS